jgi:hypothetical protein
MSKAIRIREHLYEEIERLAKEERRSLIGQLEYLLEQALRMQPAVEVSARPSTFTSADAQPRGIPDREVKPDFK